MADIKLLSQPACGQCAQAKRMLDINGIQYDTIDCTTEDGSKLADKYGIRSVPALLVNDTEVYRNYGAILTWIKANKK